MHGLFQHSDIHRVINNPPKWHYIKSSVLSNINKIVEFYHYAKPAVHNPHILARLIGSDSTPYSLDNGSYVDSIGLENTKTLQMTSNYSHGKEHIGGFYNDKLPHFLLAHNDYFNPFDAEKNWVNLKSVTPLYHPYMDLKSLYPNGKMFTGSNDYAILSINVPMLLLQHKLFEEAQANKGVSDDSPIYSTSNFIGGYVLPNMLSKQMDIAILNRLIYLFRNKVLPVVSVEKKYQMALQDVDHLIDEQLFIILDNISKCDGKIDTIMKMIPAISATNMYEVLNTPEVLYNNQNHWLIILSQLKYLNAFLEMAGNNSIKQNQGTINNAYINIVRNATIASMKMILNDYNYRDTIEEINKFTSYLNRKFT